MDAINSNRFIRAVCYAMVPWHCLQSLACWRDDEPVAGRTTVLWQRWPFLACWVVGQTVVPQDSRPSLPHSWIAMMATAWTDSVGSGGGSNHGSLALWVSIPSSRVSMGNGDCAWALLLVALLVVAAGKQWYLGAIIGPHSLGESGLLLGLMA